MELSGFKPFLAQKDKFKPFFAQIDKRCKDYYHKLNLLDQNEYLANFLQPAVHEIWKLSIFSPFRPFLTPFLAHWKTILGPPDAKTYISCVRYYRKLKLSGKNKHSTNFILL